MMTNREKLSKMSLIDILTLFNQNSDLCIFEILADENMPERCKQHSDEELSVEVCCYNCLCAWLNEEAQKG